MDVDRLLREAENTPTEGWDFARFGERLRSLPRPWNFSEIVSAHARSAATMLDLGTGGGEWLAALDCCAARTVATESWPPNVEIAERRLRPLGIAVVATESAPDNTEQVSDERRGALPFDDAEFDLVTSRHESYLPGEVGRVLAVDGVFLTQQTGGDYSGFYELLELEPPAVREPRWTLAYASNQLEEAGFRSSTEPTRWRRSSFRMLARLRGICAPSRGSSRDFQTSAFERSSSISKRESSGKEKSPSTYRRSGSRQSGSGSNQVRRS